MRFFSFFSFTIVMYSFIGCTATGDKFVGNYAFGKYSDQPVFSIAHNSDNTYSAKLVNKSSKEYIFKFNSDAKILISSDNDSMSLNGKELKFTNENGPKLFFKLK